MWGLITALSSIFVSPEFLRAYKAAPFGVWDFSHASRYHDTENDKGYSQQLFEDNLEIVRDVEKVTHREKQKVFDVSDPQQVAANVLLRLNHSVLKIKEVALDQLLGLMPHLDFDLLNRQLAAQFIDEQKKVLTLVRYLFHN
jgi:hypothetical protein